jgi:hypothetical protein
MIGLRDDLLMHRASNSSDSFAKKIKHEEEEEITLTKNKSNALFDDLFLYFFPLIEKKKYAFEVSSYLLTAEGAITRKRRRVYIAFNLLLLISLYFLMNETKTKIFIRVVSI